MSYCVGIYYVASIEKIDSLCVCEILFIYLFIVIFIFFKLIIIIIFYLNKIVRICFVQKFKGFVITKCGLSNVYRIID